VLCFSARSGLRAEVYRNPWASLGPAPEAIFQCHLYGAFIAVDLT
jgi:hypothetical protein